MVFRSSPHDRHVSLERAYKRVASAIVHFTTTVVVGACFSNRKLAKMHRLPVFVELSSRTLNANAKEFLSRPAAISSDEFLPGASASTGRENHRSGASASTGRQNHRSGASASTGRENHLSGASGPLTSEPTLLPPDSLTFERRLEANERKKLKKKMKRMCDSYPHSAEARQLAERLYSIASYARNFTNRYFSSFVSAYGYMYT